MSKLPKDLVQFTKYKWEFLRRNPEYQEDYKETQRIFNDMLNTKLNEPNRNQPSYFSLRFNFYRKKWRIRHCLNPDESYDDIVRREKDGDYSIYFSLLLPDPLDPIFNMPVKVPYGIDDEGFIAIMTKYPPSDNPENFKKHVLELDKFAETGKIKIEIDLNCSKNQLKKEFQFFLDQWKEAYKKTHKEFLYQNFCKERKIKKNSPIDKRLMKEFEELYQQETKEKETKYKHKYHFDNFDLYLRVYDLRNEGKSWNEILGEIIGILKAKGTEEPGGTIQTVRNYYRAAKEIIEKGVEAYVK